MFTDKKYYEDGEAFYQIELSNHFVDYISRDSDTLFVTFEGMMPANVPADKRPPAAHRFLKSLGVSHIGVKVKGVDWYRSKPLHELFRNKQFLEVFQRYERVFFYGLSMGGYAALVFSSAVKGAHVLALAPQSTMDPEIVGWDDRFPVSAKQDWSGDFADAADALRDQGNVYIVYDPFFDTDAKHVKRLNQEKVIKIKAPFLGHDMAENLRRFSLLKPVVRHAFDLDLEFWFPKAIRVRKGDRFYESNANAWMACRLGWQNRFQDAIPYAQRALELDIRNKLALAVAKQLQKVLAKK